MKALRLAAGFAVVLGLASCGGSDGDKANEAVMPDVEGAQLDAALADIKGAGFEDEVDVVGGGTFGVLDKSNWQVCAQSPAAGESLTTAPELTIDRSCGDDAAESTSTSTTSPESEPSTEDVLTAASTPELAALLAESDDCSDSIEAFASTYRGKTIEFDGSIGAMQNHADFDTRYDILVRSGELTGPNFQFRDVGIVDLHLTGENIPPIVGPGDKLHVVAEVESYNSAQCLLFLDPVSTEVR